MRVWDIPVSQLCNKHLIAQHHEIHCIFSIIVNGKKGFAHHPEVMRWRGNELALTAVHGDTVHEMLKRGLNHNSPLGYEYRYFVHSSIFPEPWQSVETQRKILLSKGCGCLRR